MQQELPSFLVTSVVKKENVFSYLVFLEIFSKSLK